MYAERYIEQHPQVADRLEDLQDLFNSFGLGRVSKSIDCGPGWISVILNCHKNLKLVYPGYEITQIKEKFGALRYYITSYPSDPVGYFGVNAIIDYAERKSSQTCEECGTEDYKAQVALRKEGWWHTYCNACEEKYLFNKALDALKYNVI